MNDRHPVFVYGTLRPGCGNDSLWQGRATATDDGEAYVVGYTLTTQGWFPYLVPSATSQTVGCLIWPYGDDYTAVLERMDALEGVPHHYRRITVPVLHVLGLPILTAWTYVPAPSPRHVEHVLPAVGTNAEGFFDWRTHRDSRHITTGRNNP